MSDNHGECSGIKLTRSKDGTCRVFLDYSGTLVEVITASGETIRNYAPGYKVASAIREAFGKEPIPKPQPIVIEVRGGVVQDVQNMPEGLEFEVRDYDNEEAA